MTSHFEGRASYKYLFFGEETRTFNPHPYNTEGLEWTYEKNPKTGNYEVTNTVKRDLRTRRVLETRPYEPALVDMPLTATSAFELQSDKTTAAGSQ